MQKLWQLSVAHASGLNVPESIVTNSPEQAEKFYYECDRHVIYKMISEKSHFNIPFYENPRGVATLPLREVDLKHLSQVKLAPHLFQRRIVKTCDLRVTIIGLKIFAFRIDSQRGRGKLDWRHDYSVDMEECQLPEPVASACLNLMKRLGLNYGALDFAVDEKGKHWFLEINSAGQYYWLEARTKVPLSLELAKLLCGQSEPLIGVSS
jgi:glutathione synthase/RimK-type ligase-like ATP-grasp enzyme